MLHENVGKVMFKSIDVKLKNNKTVEIILIRQFYFDCWWLFFFYYYIKPIDMTQLTYKLQNVNLRGIKRKQVV